MPKRTNKNKLGDANGRMSERARSMVSIGLRNNSWMQAKPCLGNRRRRQEKRCIHYALSSIPKKDYN